MEITVQEGNNFFFLPMSFHYWPKLEYVPLRVPLSQKSIEQLEEVQGQ